MLRMATGGRSVEPEGLGGGMDQPHSQAATAPACRAIAARAPSVQAPAEELLYTESYWEEVQARMTAHPQVMLAPTQSRKPLGFSHSAQLLAAAASLPPSVCLRCMHLACFVHNDNASLLRFPDHACIILAPLLCAQHASCAQAMHSQPSSAHRLPVCVTYMKLCSLRCVQ